MTILSIVVVAWAFVGLFAWTIANIQPHNANTAVMFMIAGPFGLIFAILTHANPELVQDAMDEYVRRRSRK